AKPRINPDHLSEDDIELLEAIYKKWEMSTTVESLRADVEALHKRTSSDMETAKRKKNVVGFLFQSKAEKEDIRAAFERLNEESHQKDLNHIREKWDKIFHFTVDKDILIQKLMNTHYV